MKFVTIMSIRVLLFSVWYCVIGICKATTAIDDNIRAGNVSLHVPDESTQDSTPCITPAHKNGTCIPLNSCQKLYDLIRSHRVREPSVVRFLHNSQCGARNKSTVHVCCPSSHDGIPPTSQCGKMDTPGMNTSSIGEYVQEGRWPWMTALYCTDKSSGKSTYQCVGSLISEEWVIMAAHCAQCPGKNSNITLSYVRISDLQSSDNTSHTEVSIKEIVLHPEFRLTGLENDIGLIRLNQSVEFTRSIRPICLLSGKVYESDNYYIKKKGIVTGWSFKRDKDNISSPAKLETRVPIISTINCTQSYAPVAKDVVIDGRVICAGSNDIDTCSVTENHYGGPMMFANNVDRRFFLGGIFSVGAECKNIPYYPAVYTRVATFIDWINNSTGLNF